MKRGPSLVVFGAGVQLRTAKVTADEEYLRESLQPDNAVAGYSAIRPPSRAN
jgi:hypothetical protein